MLSTRIVTIYARPARTFAEYGPAREVQVDDDPDVIPGWCAGLRRFMAEAGSPVSRTTAPALSERALRRSAWGLWWFLTSMVLAAVPMAFVSSSPGSWGPSGLAGEVAYLIIVMAFPLVGLLILRLQPRNTIGWILMGIGGVSAVSSLADNYATYGLLVNPGSLPGPLVVAGLNEGSWAPWIGLMGTFLILLYPDGRLPSPRWRPLGWLCAVTITVVTVSIVFLPGEMEEGPVAGAVNPLGSRAVEPVLTVVLGVFLPLLPLCIVACAVALVGRFRRSVGIERLQLKWLAAAAAVVALLYLLTMVTVSLFELTPLLKGAGGVVTAVQTVSILSFVLLPGAIGIAILRHRLYDIDIVINRALVYGLLTAMLGAVYLGSVLLLQLVLSPVTQSSDLAVAGSTLAVAGLFGPARVRTQNTVDRHFYRGRYDATRTIDAFADRLRHEVDLDAVGSGLQAAVNDTVQPAHVSLWLRP
jgi:hypothetical protein